MPKAKAGRYKGSLSPAVFKTRLFGLAQPLSNGTLRAVGDSITVGTASSNGNLAYSSLVTAKLGYTQSDLALASTQIVDQCTSNAGASNQVYLGTSLPATDMWVWLTGYNDMRYFGTDATGLETYKRTLTSAVAWISRKASDCKQTGSDAAWTLTGSWTQVIINGLTTSYSASSGDSASIVLNGTAITLSYMSHFGLGDGGTFSVKIDGVTVNASVDTDFGSLSGFAASSTTSVPMALRFGGLAPGNHTLLVTLTSSAVVQLCFACGNAGGSNAVTPRVFLAPSLKMISSAYGANSPYNKGSDAAVALYGTTVELIVRDAKADNREVYFADVNKYYSVSNGLSGDSVHPNDIGHAQIYNAILNAT